MWRSSCQLQMIILSAILFLLLHIFSSFLIVLLLYHYTVPYLLLLFFFLVSSGYFSCCFFSALFARWFLQSCFTFVEVGAGRKRCSGSADRFIPNRTTTDMEYAAHSLVHTGSLIVGVFLSFILVRYPGRYRTLATETRKII